MNTDTIWLMILAATCIVVAAIIATTVVLPIHWHHQERMEGYRTRNAEEWRDHAAKIISDAMTANADAVARVVKQVLNPFDENPINTGRVEELAGRPTDHSKINGMTPEQIVTAALQAKARRGEITPDQMDLLIDRTDFVIPRNMGTPPEAYAAPVDANAIKLDGPGSFNEFEGQVQNVDGNGWV